MSETKRNPIIVFVGNEMDKEQIRRESYKINFAVEIKYIFTLHNLFTLLREVKSGNINSVACVFSYSCMSELIRVTSDTDRQNFYRGHFIALARTLQQHGIAVHILLSTISFGDPLRDKADALVEEVQTDSGELVVHGAATPLIAYLNKTFAKE